LIKLYFPQAIYGAHLHERLVSADLSISGNRIYLYPAAYPDFQASIDDIQLMAGSSTLSGITVGTTDILAYEYALPDQVMDQPVQIWCRGSFLGRLHLQNRHPVHKVFLTAATLFKDDYAQLETWVDYHASLGFERFVLYYNGLLDALIPELFQSKLLRAQDLLLIAWPYSYWVEGQDLGAEGLIAQHGANADLSKSIFDWHHAQQIMLNHALIYLRGSTDYLAFFDVDEYFMFFEKRNIADFVRDNGRDIYIFQSRWAEVVSQRVPSIGDSAAFFASQQIVVAPNWEPFPSRTKYIARPEVVLSTGAHTPKIILQDASTVKVATELAGIFHFHAFSGKADRRILINPEGKWISCPYPAKLPIS
jgi:hypothetical protein